MDKKSTERVHLAKKYLEKVAQMRALFEQQARDHQPYPRMPSDDVLNASIHRTKDSKPLKDQIEAPTHHSGGH